MSLHRSGGSGISVLPGVSDSPVPGPLKVGMSRAETVPGNLRSDILIIAFYPDELHEPIKPCRGEAPKPASKDLRQRILLIRRMHTLKNTTYEHKFSTERRCLACGSTL